MNIQHISRFSAQPFTESHACSPRLAHGQAVLTHHPWLMLLKEAAAVFPPCLSPTSAFIWSLTNWFRLLNRQKENVHFKIAKGAEHLPEEKPKQNFKQEMGRKIEQEKFFLSSSS